MPYLQPYYDHDMFVSYAHADMDGSGRSPLKEWSLEFKNELEQELRLIHGYNSVRVYIDVNRDPDHGVDRSRNTERQITEAVKSSGVLMPLITTHYLDSNWCGDERTWWLDAVSEAKLSTDGRIFRIHTLPIALPQDEKKQWHKEDDEARLPKELQGPVGFWMFSSTNVNVGTRPHCWRGSNIGLDDRQQELLAIVENLASRLNKIKRDCECREREIADINKLRATGGQSIYLFARDDQEAEWLEARDELRQAGYTVSPLEPEDWPPAGDPQASRLIDLQRVELMGDCDCVLLLAANTATAIDSAISLVGRTSVNEARARFGRPLPCAVLDKVGEPITITARLNRALGLGVDWLDCTNSPMSDVVREWLARTTFDAAA